MHDYPYFGITRDGRLYAYAGCFVAGEFCEIQTIYGHAAHQPDGIIPLLITSIAECLIRDYSEVKYYSFGSYFGANETMRRFKRKFGFQPHKVTWKLGL
jgi:GNAT superfamily N-acetyltransferase